MYGFPFNFFDRRGGGDGTQKRLHKYTITAHNNAWGVKTGEGGEKAEELEILLSSKLGCDSIEIRFIKVNYM